MQADLLLQNQTGPKTTQQVRSVGMENIITAIKSAAQKTGVDFAYLLNKASQESGMNPSAKASTSSATGLYQFVNQTWLQMVKEHGAEYGLQNEAQAINVSANGKLSVTDKDARDKILNMRNDPVLASAMAAEFTKDNKDYLNASVGGNIGSTELYMAHFLGAGGASQFLKALHQSPKTAAADILPEAAEANPSVFYNKNGQARSVADIYAKFAAKFSDKGVGQMMALAEKGNGAIAANTTIKRDFSEYSSSFYDGETQDRAVTSDYNYGSTATTSDTLFNVMIMAQNNMSSALRSFTKMAKDDHMETTRAFN